MLSLMQINSNAYVVYIVWALNEQYTIHVYANFILLYIMLFQMTKTAYSAVYILNPLDSDVCLYS